MIKEWIEPDKCTGCAACANICPKNAIDMKKDRYGFINPKVLSNCINCGQCETVCNSRVTLYDNANYSDAKVYAAWSKDEKIRFKSTSGGVFSEFAIAVLQQNGVVVGAGYGADNLVYHMIVNDEMGLEKIRQSKYIQSEIGLIFRDVKNYLSQNILVLFCGTPCQVAGLKAFLKKDYDNLITIDFVCRGVNSPKAYQAWLKEIEKKNRKKIKRVWFKYKDGGWKSSPTRTRIDFTDGSYKVFEGGNNAFMFGYLGPNLYIRPSCGICDFKKEKRLSDISVGDFWGVNEDLDDDKGTSLVMINSLKGQIIFENIVNNISYYECKYQDIMNGNICLTSSVSINPESKAFLDSLSVGSFSKCLSKYTTQNKSFKSKIINVLKRIERKIK